eukprot:6393057-Pyramimonas_sp.AAC.1
MRETHRKRMIIHTSHTDRNDITKHAYTNSTYNNMNGSSIVTSNYSVNTGQSNDIVISSQTTSHIIISVFNETTTNSNSEHHTRSSTSIDSNTNANYKLTVLQYKYTWY